MGKLWKFKDWISLAEAAKHLSTVLNEGVSEADLLRLALDNRLELSVVFVDSVHASVCKVIDEDIEYEEFPALGGVGGFKLPKGGQVIYDPMGRMRHVQSQVDYLDTEECYDLTMMGGERGCIEQRYWDAIGESREETTSIDGTYVKQGVGLNARWFQLKGNLPRKQGEVQVSYPLGGLPESAVIVVRPKALQALEASLLDEPAIEKKPEKPLGTRERDTLLTIIAALCKEAKIPYDKPAKAAGMIQSTAAAMGVSIGETTIEGHLKKIPDALATRMK